jgi:hypothetical protein
MQDGGELNRPGVSDVLATPHPGAIMSSTVTPLHPDHDAPRPDGDVVAPESVPEPDRAPGRPIVLIAVVFAVVTPLIQNVAGLGLSQGEFAARGDATLRVEGYAFAIWGLIYAGLVAYAVRQAFPGKDASHLRGRLAWPSIAAFFGIGLWIIVAAMGLQIASVIVIFASLLALLLPLLANARHIRGVSPASHDRWLVVWPLSALAGWLTVAAPLNLVSAATALGAIPAGAASTGWALLAAAGAALIALFGAWRLRTLAFPLPVAWGLIGAFVAEQSRNPVLGFAALAFALGVSIAAFVIVFGLKRPRPDGEG